MTDNYLTLMPDIDDEPKCKKGVDAVSKDGLFDIP